jgi:hypothetical protein
VSDYIIRRWNFEIHFIGLAQYICHQATQRSACIQPEGKECFTETPDSPLLRKHACTIQRPRTKSVHGRQKWRDRQEIDENISSYYLIDRGTATSFWLMESTATELGLQPAGVSDSASHLSKYRAFIYIYNNMR